MDDLMLIEYLKNKGIGRDMSEREFMDKFKEFIAKDRKNYMRQNEIDEYPLINREYEFPYMREHDYSEELDKMSSSDRDRHRLFDRFNRITENRSSDSMYKDERSLRNKITNEHFNDSYAKYLVSNMYHLENGRKHVGEKFNMSKAKEICERYRGIIPQTITYADIYVAINSQYHDYCELFKAWFGDGIEQKIIESAIIFWFKDSDYKDSFKLWNYFKES